MRHGESDQNDLAKTCSHVSANFGAAFAIGVGVNALFVGIQIVFGIFAHSLALIADAGHNLGDVLCLVLAWIATALARRAPTERRTYGLRSTTILAALFNAVLLLIAVGAIMWEAIHRLGTNVEVAAPTMIGIAALGILVNGATALMFMSGRKLDLNIRAAFTHMAADAAISFGVVLAGAAILATGWHWIDPVTSLLIAIVIIWGTWGLLRDSIDLVLQAVPRGIEIREVRKYLADLPHVTAVHDLHIWPMSTTETALTAHLVRDVSECDCSLLDKAAQELRDQFHIHHATLQFETSDHECSLAPDQNV
jgi:cobalt-zinc-cadmium efflux system protein